MVTTIKISEITYYRLISLLSHNIDIIPTLWYPTIEIYGKQNLISNNIRKNHDKKNLEINKNHSQNQYIFINPTKNITISHKNSTKSINQNTNHYLFPTLQVSTHGSLTPWAIAQN